MRAAKKITSTLHTASEVTAAPELKLFPLLRLSSSYPLPSCPPDLLALPRALRVPRTVPAAASASPIPSAGREPMLHDVRFPIQGTLGIYGGNRGAPVGDVRRAGGCSWSKQQSGRCRPLRPASRPRCRNPEEPRTALWRRGERCSWSYYLTWNYYCYYYYCYCLFLSTPLYHSGERR